MRRFSLFLLLAFAGTDAIGSTIVFSTDFTTVTGSGTFLGAGTFTQSGPGNDFLQNTSTGRPAPATRLLLNGLPGHYDLTLVFTFWAIDSWDGVSNPCCGTDYFNIRLDGVLIYSAAFRNWGIVPARVEDESRPGAATLIFSSNTNLTGNPEWSDSIWQILLPNLPHTSGSATIEFFASGTGWDGGTDESFGLDNLSVQVTETLPAEIPEPGNFWMCVLTLGMTAAAIKLKALPATSPS